MSDPIQKAGARILYWQAEGFQTTKDDDDCIEYALAALDCLAALRRHRWTCPCGQAKMIPNYATEECLRCHTAMTDTHAEAWDKFGEAIK